MKATELRIGNLVEYNGFSWKVSEICSPKPLKDERYADKWIIELFDGAGLISVPIEDIEPIELTEEWLIKAGFELLNFDSYEFDGYKILSKQCGKLQLCADSSNNYKTVEHKYLPIILYVHQLQNLYWCLCGKELDAYQQTLF